VEEEVKNVETKIHVRIVELEVGIKPLVVVQVETTKIVAEETNVHKNRKYFHFIFCHFTRILGTESKV